MIHWILTVVALLIAVPLWSQKCCEKLQLQFCAGRQDINFAKTNEYQLSNFLIKRKMASCTYEHQLFIAYGEKHPPEQQLFLSTRFTEQRLMITKGRDTMIVDLYMPFNLSGLIEKMKFQPGYYILDLELQTGAVRMDEAGLLHYKGVNGKSLRKDWVREELLTSFQPLTKTCENTTYE